MKELQETRLEAEQSGREVWIEWKEHPVRDIRNPRQEDIIKDRVNRLAIALQSENKPKEVGLVIV